jgi:hypothetical protein
VDLQELTIHGRRMSYRTAGSGPVILLIHGMAGSATTWKQVMPALIIWGDSDPIIPVNHAHEAHAAIPGSQLESFEGVGDYPHCEAPERFVELLSEFIEESQGLSAETSLSGQGRTQTLHDVGSTLDRDPLMIIIAIIRLFRSHHKHGDL